MNGYFRFWTLKMDSLTKKMTTHDVCFSVQVVTDFFLPPYQEGQGKKELLGLRINSATVYELGK